MTLHLGDCLDVLPTLDAESIDAIVTDPPYGLEFMGKEWDRLTAIPDRDQGPRGRNAYGGWHGSAGTDPRPMQDWHNRWAVEAFRVAKPGAHLLAFGGTRTYHRLASAIEDAGWEIRDTLVWAYASGFPKSLDVSKAIDKAAGAEVRYEKYARQGGGYDGTGKHIGQLKTESGVGYRPIPNTDAAREWQGWGTALKPAWEPIVLARKPLRGTVAANVLAYGTGALNIDATRIAAEPYAYPNGAGGTRFKFDPTPNRTDAIESNPLGRWPANVILTDPIFDGDTPGVVGGGEADGAISNGRRAGNGAMFDPGESMQVASYGDSGTYSRFFLVPKSSRSDREPVLGGLPMRRMADDGPIVEFVHPAPAGIGAWLREQRELAGLSLRDVARHFPSRTGGLTGAVSNWEMEANRPTPEQWVTLRAVIGFGELHDAAMTTQREVSLEERNERSESQDVRAMRAREGRADPRQNSHPTVKPTDLMRHLVRLVTPPGGLVLDPFMGSGSTALACEMEGFRWVGIEREAEYVAIAEARLNGTQRGLGLVG